jgi:predicted Na+-dependent transporter
MYVHALRREHLAALEGVEMMLQVVTERILPLALTLSIQIFAVSSMLMVGLRYTVGDLVRPLRDVKGVVIALVTNFVLVPLLAVLLLRFFSLEPPYATGLIIVAAAGGAPLLVKLAMNAKADVAFAASLIVLLLVGSIIAMPIIMPLLAEGATVSPWAIARPLLITMFLPLVVGLFIIRPRFPALSQRAVPILAKILTIALWTMVALSLFLNRGAVIGIFGEGAILLSLSFFAIAYGIGYLSGGLDKPEREVLGFGASQRNFAAAVVVATGAFEDRPAPENNCFAGPHDFWAGDKEVHVDGYATDILSNRAADYVKRHAKNGPYLLSVHYTAPHWPWETRDDRAEAERIKNIFHLDGGSVEIYQRMIHHMDEGIGRILQAVNESAARDNTLVLFTSDNGGERFSDSWPLSGKKMDLLEGGIRVPYIVRWPARIKAATVNDRPVVGMDWMATFLAAAGVKPHKDYPLDGVDVFGPDIPRNLFWRMLFRNQKAVRSGDWKWLSMDGNEFLFNLKKDQRERANLRYREPERFAELRRTYFKWDESMPVFPEDAAYTLVYDEHSMAKPAG